MVKMRRLIPPVLAVVLVISLASLSMQGAQGTTSAVDQQCSTIGGTYLDGVGVHQPAGQTFIPAQSSMTGFSLYLLSDNPTSTSMTANIISNGVAGVDGVQGNLVGSVTFTVPGLFGQPTGAWLNVQLPSGIVLTPGVVYAVSLVDNSGSAGIKWSACSTPYTNGCGYANGLCQASSWAFMDYYGDFSVGILPTGISIPQGASGTVTLYVSSQDNFASPVMLTYSAPPGVTASFNGQDQVETAAGATSSPSVTIYVAGTTPPGTYPFTVRASSGGISHSAKLDLIVTSSGPVIVSSPNPDFVLQPSTGEITLTPGISKSTTIVLSSVNGFTSSVSLEAAWSGAAPDGVTVSLPSPVTVPAESSVSPTLTLTTDSSPSIGTYTLILTTTNGVISHAIEIAVNIAGTPPVLAPVAVPDFSISSITQPPPITQMSLTPDTTESSTILISSVNGFSSSVNLEAACSGASPDGVIVSLPSPVTVPTSGSASSTLTLTTNDSPSTGSYVLFVTATNGEVTHSTQISAVIGSTPPVLAPVTPAYVGPLPDFSISPTTDTLSLSPGLSTGTTVMVNSFQGFSAPVTFSVSWIGNAPTDIIANTPQSVTPPAGGTASSAITFTSLSGRSTGEYIAQVTATSGTVTHSTEITVFAPGG